MKAEDIKRMDIAEFRKEGYLQEVNRRFLHPLGLALEVIIEDGKERLGGIWDYRGDPEGMHFGINDSDQERKDRMLEGFNKIEKVMELRNSARVNKLGYFVEPVIEREKKSLMEEQKIISSEDRYRLFQIFYPDAEWDVCIGGYNSEMAMNEFGIPKRRSFMYHVGIKHDFIMRFAHKLIKRKSPSEEEETKIFKKFEKCKTIEEAEDLYISYLI